MKEYEEAKRVEAIQEELRKYWKQYEFGTPEYHTYLPIIDKMSILVSHLYNGFPPLPERLPDVTKEQAIKLLSQKLFGAPKVIRAAISDAIYKLSHSDIEPKKVMEWFYKIESAYYEMEF